MSFNFSAAYPTGPTAQSPAAKDLQVKAIKLTASDFTTGGATALKAVLPADASIVSISYWKKAQFSGGGVTAVSLQLTGFFSGLDVFTPATGAQGFVNVVSNIAQDYNIPLGQDIQLTTVGTATTGNPTAGELYLFIQYVR